MSQTDPLRHLNSFYESLDAIPTPALTVKPPTYKGLLGLVLAPLAMSLVAYGFISFCASGSGHITPVPMETPAERFALKALQQEIASKSPGPHAMTAFTRRIS